MKKNDIILISIILIVAGFFLCIQHFIPSDSNASIEITVDGNTYGKYPLSEDETIMIGDTNQLMITSGEASMKSANCPDQLCVHQNKISKSGESIICLPNKVIITVIGGEEREVDTVSN